MRFRLKRLWLRAVERERERDPNLPRLMVRERARPKECDRMGVRERWRIGVWRLLLLGVLDRERLDALRDRAGPRRGVNSARTALASRDFDREWLLDWLPRLLCFRS